MTKVALVNPSYYDEIFSKSKARAAITRGTTPLGIASLAASLLKDGHEVRIWDLNLMVDPLSYLKKESVEFEPDVVGITSTTPIIKKAYEIAGLIKKINRGVLVIAGGPHPSALPEEVLRESEIDCVVRGEGEFIINDIACHKPFKLIPNIIYKTGNNIQKSEKQDWVIENVDSLPFPAYELLDIKKYHQPRISSRREPLGYLETSRGCYGRCIFCNKNINGYRMRMKSPDRVINEIKRMLDLGFKEIQIIDDIFTADLSRAYEICEKIIKNKLKFSWYPRGGIRVDRVSPELLKIMKKAGCYRIPFGAETGSQRILDTIKKGITLEQSENAVLMAKKAGLETECYFMLGLPTEMEEDIEATIKFAIKLDPDYVKFAMAIPFPGTEMFDTMQARGQIKTRDWSRYNFSASLKELYDHDTLSWETIERYYDISHRRFYFRIAYILKMAVKTVAEGTLLDHLKAFLKTRW